MVDIYRPDTYPIGGYDVVGGRLDLGSATSIRYGFLSSSQIRLFNPTIESWQVCNITTEPTISNTALDLNGTALAVDKIYDIFAEYSSATAFTLVASRWQTATAGSSSRVAVYDAGTTYNIGDRVTYGGHDWVCIQSGTGQTPSAGAYWVDNGTSVSGDFAGLYRHNGVLVSDSSTAGKSRRWLGIIYTYNNSGTVNFRDDVNYRYVSNWYNRENKIVSAFNYSTVSWTYNVAAWREFNNGNLYRGYFVSCCEQSTMSAVMATFKSGSSTATSYVSSAINNTAASVVQIVTAATTMQTYEGMRATSLASGFSYITLLEYGNATYPSTFYGYESQSNHNVLLRG